MHLQQLWRGADYSVGIKVSLLEGRTTSSLRAIAIAIATATATATKELIQVGLLQVRLTPDLWWQGCRCGKDGIRAEAVSGGVPS